MFGWRVAFFLAACTQFMAAIVYLLFASCEEQSWSKNLRFKDTQGTGKDKNRERHGSEAFFSSDTESPF
ncbi:hypothetical protein Ciccas_001749 [Cichlidogyrus casuarinus]|uniref:Uncharacterized protein n=1 Tax=Cichlidogyrus casuarinus TaxID=1844966 RepID=A0ABD2QJH1_9PLAT